jgi:hypothetical protein
MAITNAVLGFLDDDAVLRALLTADDAVVVSSIQENIPRPTDDDTLHSLFAPGSANNA